MQSNALNNSELKIRKSEGKTTVTLLFATALLGEMVRPHKSRSIVQMQPIRRCLIPHHECALIYVHVCETLRWASFRAHIPSIDTQFPSQRRPGTFSYIQCCLVVGFEDCRNVPDQPLKQVHCSLSVAEWTESWFIMPTSWVIVVTGKIPPYVSPMQCFCKQLWFRAFRWI